jgi:hypothetical protein
VGVEVFGCSNRRLKLQKPAPIDLVPVSKQCRMIRPLQCMPPGIRTFLGDPILFLVSNAFHVLSCQPRFWLFDPNVSCRSPC